MKNILIIALMIVALACVSADVLAAPSDANPGNANHYGWDTGAGGIAVPELDPGLLICALILLVGGTCIMTSQWRKKTANTR